MSTRFLVAAVLLLAGCTTEPARAGTQRATPATLTAVLKAAKDGDTVVLARGSYGDVSVPRADHASPVTIDAARARLRTLTLRGTAGWRWTGGTIAAPPEAFRAVMIDNARRVELTDVRIADGLSGAQVISSQDVTLRGNTITGMIADGINVVASQRVKILGNTIAEFRPLEVVRDAGGRIVKDAPHSDAIQLWSLAGKEPARDIAIIGNRISGKAQGITHFWHAAQGRPKVERVTVERNEVAVESWWGIGMLDTPGAIVRHNTVRTLANGKGLRARLLAEKNVIRCGNTVGDVSERAC